MLTFQEFVAEQISGQTLPASSPASMPAPILGAPKDGRKAVPQQSGQTLAKNIHAMPRFITGGPDDERKSVPQQGGQDKSKNGEPGSRSAALPNANSK